MKLMIVESPTKAKKIGSLLGSDWRVEASMGHIVDLPTDQMAVEPQTYQLTYVASERGRSVISRLKPLVAEADAIYLATDPDREGEAISEHLKRYLRIERYQRVTFNEITETGIKAALAAPRPIDRRLVAAQEARRAADRLIGYRVSFPISTAAGQSLTAGRCQSPAVRLVVERQNEIDRFKVTDHFSALAEFENGSWTAEWQTKSFLQGDDEYILDQSLAERAAACRRFTVTAAAEKPVAKGPPAPFTTSALLQAAGATLGYPPALTQKLAQSLFEAGLITYHRTDNPNLSDDGIAAIGAYAEGQGWQLSEKKRRWPLPEGAQEAHEAIRPTHVEDREAGEDDKQKALYKLIWQRAVASQLADAVYKTVTLDLTADAGGERFHFRARSAELVKQGWRIVAADEKSDDEDEDESTNGRVPMLQPGTSVTATGGKILRKATKPPRRYTETSLIRKLEQMGIGRPSTFAAIVSNICNKKYVVVEKRYLVPTQSGRAIVGNLVGRFDFAEYDFTKDLEKRLDLIAEGRERYVDVIADLDQRLDVELGKLASVKPAHPCPKCGKALRLVTGKSRSFFGCSGYRDGCPVICENDNGKPGAVIERSDTPSEKQAAFAKRIAEENGLSLPEEVMASAKALSVWIDEALAAAPPRLASDKQREFIATLIEQNGLQPPAGWPDNVTSDVASAFISKNGKAKGKSKPARRRKAS
ncbi:type I DNA topoisomerase (plasmid) [Rhizobium oryzihabitans]|uniref:DNA topoisomerase 1 n=3 Tax=Pseudomonadota TaxID=1224 RepID=A0A7L5BRH2_9HYPH|nr:type I DNA topoisomerase [Rhizobium oryzihabitans]WPE24097.1 DNA topoisomerase 1 [Shinella zoogloeoides]